MRDIGALLWVVIVIAGVVSSIVSNARKQAARSQAVPRTPQPRPQPPPAVPPSRRPQAVRVTGPGAAVPAGPARPSAPSPPPHEESLHVGEMPRSRSRTSLFANRTAVVRAVIAAEVLGKPRALRDEY